MQGIVCRIQTCFRPGVDPGVRPGVHPAFIPGSGLVPAIGAGITIAGLAGDPCMAYRAFLKVERAVGFPSILAGLVRRIALAGLPAFDQSKPHPDSPDHGSKSKKFGK